MPFQGTYPADTFVRTDGTRTGLHVWEDAQSAGLNILATAMDRHDQDIASAINTLNGRITQLDSAIGMVLLSEATASTSHAYEFTLSSANENRIVISNLSAPQAAPADVVLQFRAQAAASAVNSALMNSADAYYWVRDGYSGEPSALVLDGYDSAHGSIVLATGIAQENNVGLSCVIDIRDAHNASSRTVVEGRVFYGRMNTPRSLNVLQVGGTRNRAEVNHVVVITVSQDPVAGRIQHYGIRRPGNNNVS